ncbi:salicylate synthase [Clavibacter michiganensis]|uniref:salicylate synthase n=2 Tax=Clavibacter michiganensis TaxID=28447 RepID=UPI0013651FDE|nr:salicylate synthase [Clavibacter michiganensis]MDO4019226.1 salicylate synthase [Clavibacter michiganensis]MDO4039094.1 salicylate synthase [Clavibacter michiganensis]MDO4051295.1 salicylate synthase [Clavibacter michiganensis]MDO4063746.1 salicylate synthase [Clavibacter michiganensis]MDO4084782.1 salicylate synthase [Clavibacter michiganensis]
MPAAPVTRVAELRITRDPLGAVADLARAFRDEPHVILEEAGRFSCAIGAWAEVVVDRRVVRLRVRGEAEVVVPWRDRPLRVVDRLLAGLGPDRGRAYGTACFELARAHAGMPVAAEAGELLHVILPRTEVVIADGLATVRSGDAREAAEVARILGAAEPAPSPSPEPHPCPAPDRPGVVDPEEGRARYLAAVASGVAAIHAGELQKVVVSRRVPVTGEVDLPATFVRGRRANTPARSYLLGLGGIEAVGFSPEIVVAVDARGTVRTQPLAGTRALVADPIESRRLREELLSDAKEIHEHAISVKLAVEEMAPVCRPGSVRVEEFMVVEERGTVQHLGSRVAGELADGLTCWDALAALFPAVTASGVPKRAAFDLIRRLEGHDRDLYAGAVLRIEPDGALDAALALRTLFRRGDATWLQAGAGVVGASSPARELEETREKLASIADHVVRAREPGRAAHASASVDAGASAGAGGLGVSVTAPRGAAAGR